MIKSISGINHYGKRIMTIDKDNTTAACHVCSENEDWEHVLSCAKNKDNREEWEKAV